jgi:DNA-binding transcriptional ArsR family regulator
MSTPDGPIPEVRLDARTLRGLAHPLRVRILGLLRSHGPATSTTLAIRLGLSSAATSYHLRQLAEHGFVVEDVELGQRRERWWRAASRATYLDVGQTLSDPAAAADTEAYLRAVARISADRVQAHLDEKLQLPPRWRAAGTLSDIQLRLTPAQADDLAERIWALVEQYPRADSPTGPPADGGSDDGDDAEDTRAVDVQLTVFPVPGDPT